MPIVSRNPSYSQDSVAQDASEIANTTGTGIEEEDRKPVPKSLGMFAKAQIRNLTPDFTQWMSHA